MEGAKELEEYIETPRLGCNYITPGVSLEFRSRVSSPERNANTNGSITMTSKKEGSHPLNPFPKNLDSNSTAGAAIRLPTFNGNGAEDPKQHWFLCEVVWMVRLVHNANIKKAQMITNLRGRTLDWFINFSVAPIGTL